MESKTNEKSGSSELPFEKELYTALKAYGYLFPGNSKEVKSFDDLYGDTPIDTPERFDLTSKMKIALENLDFEIEFSSAAFAPKSDESFDLSDEILAKDTEREGDSNSDK
jgi:hypothetical protein